ncbi:MAG TPA: SCO family protein [Propionicimonas sp.]|nr:SCO family protein [Propionicimonas sp.]HRA05149.1 SCO family protein [Propionicimonas sp.]
MAVVLALALAGCVASAQVTSPSAGQSASAFGGVELTTPYALPDLTLTDDAGNDFNVRTGSDAPVLVFYYGYTNCPDICLGVLTDLASAMNRLGEADRERIQVIFVTVDPARDTPAVLSKYLSRIDPQFIGLTGEQAEIETLMASMGVGVAGIEKTADGGYEVNHTAQVVGFNRKREGVLVWTQGTSIGVLKADFETLVRQQG